ncbi:endonuclease [Escherichia phage C119]|uniref:Endonuclease n=1 Tax=Escherichia phage C119 TaxID=1735565 RepID=A0A0P0IXZ4_9CAUD|nr:HNH endonuclease [Escherichia phage C119]ALJ98907.1 endonuclease [Escherichia phage C119]
MNWDKYFDIVDGKLVWKYREEMRPQWNARYQGKEAGAIRNGYLQTEINGKCYFCHRIMWEMINGRIPDGMCIDHLNHKRDDNRIENLRVVSHQDNCKNQSLRLKNKSGVSGVYWNKKANKWLAQISIKGKRKHVGFFLSISDAENAIKQARKENLYHENHCSNI